MYKLLTILMACCFFINVSYAGHPNFSSPSGFESTFPNVMCNVNVTTSNGGITITGLTSDANTKLFNASVSNVLFSCNPWQGNPCTGTETVSGLTVGATYFLSVQSSQCSEWIPIVVAGGGGNGGGGGLFAVSNCPEDISIEVPHGGNYSTQVNWSPPTGTTDCPQGGLTVTKIQGPSPGINFVTTATGRTVVYEIKDACGNSEFCIFELFLYPEPTIVTCPPDVTVTATSAQGAVVNYDFPSLVSFCSQQPWELTEGLPSGSVFPVGTTQINYGAFLTGPAGFCQTRSNCNIDITVLPQGGGCTLDYSTSDGDIFVTGLSNSANAKIFDQNFNVVWGCNPWQTNVCGNNEAAYNLTVGATYYLSVISPTCNKWIPIVVQGGGGCPDNDNDGVCNSNDCQPNNPSLPTTPGSSCNDFNSNTTNDVIQSDGCTCAGSPSGGGNGPDLLTNNLSIGSGQPGEILGFTFNLVNQGNSTASGDYFIRSYISTDGTLSNNDIQEGVILTGNTVVGSTQVSGAITVPNLSPGTYTFFLVVDDGNAISESNENNNVRAASLVITSGGGGCNPSNVAQGKSATQSSTITAGGVTGNASKAVDGNTNGNFFAGSVSATTAEQQGWWQVDLGSSYDVSSIEVFNRTEGSARLYDFYIFTSNTPITASDVATARNQADNEQYYAGQGGTPTTWNFSGGPVRYVRVQRVAIGHVTLAEVKVFGCPNNLNTNDTQGFVATEESTNAYKVIELFPNPTTGEVISRINSNSDADLTVQIINTMGQIMREEQITLEKGINSFLTNLNDFENGIYQLIFTNGREITTKRIIKVE